VSNRESHGKEFREPRLIPVHRLMSGGLEGGARTCLGLLAAEAAVLSPVDVVLGSQVAPQRAADLDGG
jgi:hypothetical protein